jgi:hypothetical protein
MASFLLSPHLLELCCPLGIPPYGFMSVVESAGGVCFVPLLLMFLQQSL